MIDDQLTEAGASLKFPTIGHNRPPDPIEILREQLVETHADLAKRCADLLAMEARLPEAMDDDWEGKISEAIKSCTKFSRNSEVTRLDANEPHRALIAATDGFFKAMSDKVDALKAKMSKEYLTPYQQKKADAEKRRREEEARVAKAKADEEERTRREEAARVAAAKHAEDEARREAERAEAARVAAERQAAEAKDREQREAAAAAIAKANREAQEARAATERAHDERKEQERIAAEARDRAAAATQERNVTTKAAKANAADMSRTRTDLGAVASLRTTWKHEIIDATLVPFTFLSVNESAIIAAIRSATKDGKCTLKIPGVRIYPVTDSVVR